MEELRERIAKEVLKEKTSLLAYRCWEILMVVLSEYSVWAFPFEAAFLGFYKPRNLFIVHRLVDLSFAIDIGLTLVLAHMDSGEMVVRYLSPSFVMDVASTIPYDLIVHFIPSSYQTGAYCLLGMLRLWRLQRVHQFLNRFRCSWVSWGRLWIEMLFWFHCAACLFYLSADKYSDETRAWLLVLDPNFGDERPWVRYLAARHWSGNLETTYRDHDGPILDPAKLIIIIAFVLFNYFIYAYLIARVVSLSLLEWFPQLLRKTN